MTDLSERMRTIAATGIAETMKRELPHAVLACERCGEAEEVQHFSKRGLCPNCERTISEQESRPEGLCSKSPDAIHLWMHGYPHRDVYICVWCGRIVPRACDRDLDAPGKDKGPCLHAESENPQGHRWHRAPSHLDLFVCVRCHRAATRRDLSPEELRQAERMPWDDGLRASTTPEEGS